MLLIIDNQSQFIRSLYGLLHVWRVPYERAVHDQPLDVERLRRRVAGLVLSGGAGKPTGPLNLSADFAALAELAVPTLGICLGHQVVSHHFGGQLADCSEEQDKMEDVFLSGIDPLLAGLKSPAKLREAHRYYVSRPPDGFLVLGRTKAGTVEIIRHPNRPVYGLQSHPEVSGPDGERIIRNFLGICRLNIRHT
jgi:GMP synthase (glutamine-hydrolysing)